MIEVRLFATFREGREKIVFLDAAKLACVGDILAEIEISPQQVAICLVNGFHANADTTVQDADVVALFPPVGGG